MSTQVDERVLEMRFDNAQFEKACAQSMKTLEKLDESLTLKNAGRGFLGLQKAAETVSFGKIQNSLGALEKRFSVWGEVSTNAVMSVVNAITGKLMTAINEFTLKPIMDGFNEYELKMDSVQTIMAGSGKSMEEVNKYLMDLNTYSDKTIYSFRDMTASIGKFTNAGVELGDAVAAIKGIANEAARSGANANEASRAMYNFSQALSTGSVKLIDWKSIENANMATVEFKQTLIDVAESQGMLKKSGDGYIATSKAMGQKMKENMTATKGFNDSLSAQWMTADVLTEALKIYANDVKSMSETERKAYHQALVEKYGEERAKEFEELGSAATGAATEVRTFSMMMDALKEAAGSGWATTMELIFGNFEQAKEMWTNVNNVLSGIVDGVSDARNQLLMGALGENVWSKDWADVTKNVDNMDELIAKSKELGEQAGWDVDGLIKRYGSFEESLQAGWLTTSMFNDALKETGNTASQIAQPMEDLMSTVQKVIGGEYGNSDERMRKLIDAGYDYATIQALVNAQLKGIDVTTGELTEEQIQEIAATEEQAEALRNLSKTAEESGTSLSDAASLAADLAEQRLSGREHLLGGISDLFFNVQKIFSAIKQGWDMAFKPLNAEKLYDILKAFHEWTASLRMTDTAAENLAKGVAGFLKPFNIILKIVSSLFGFVMPKIGWLIKTAAPIIAAVFEFVGRVLSFIYDNFTRIGSAIQNKFVKPIREGIGGKALSLLEKLKGYFDGLKKYLKTFGTFFKPVTDAFKSVGDKADEFFGPLTDAVSNSVVTQAITTIGGAFDQLSTAIDNTVQYIKDLANYTALFSAVGNAFGGLISTLNENFWEVVTSDDDDAVPKFFEKSKAAFGTFRDAVVSAFTEYGSFQQLLEEGPPIFKTIAGAFTTIKDAINGVLQPIRDFADWTDLFKRFGTVFISIPKNIKNAFKMFNNGDIDLSGLFWQIVNTFRSLPSRIVSIIKDTTNIDEMFGFIVNGVKTLKDRVIDVFEEFAGYNPFDKLIERAKDFFPSFYSLFGGQKTVTFEDGSVMELQNDTDGLMATIRTIFERGANENASFAEKVVSTAGKVYRFLKNVATSITDFVTPVGEFFSNIFANAKAGLDGVDIIGKLKSDFGWLKDQVKTIFGDWFQNGGSLGKAFESVIGVFSEFKKRVVDTFKSIKGNDEVIPRLSEQIQKIRKWLGKIGPFIESIFAKAKKLFGAINKAVQGPLKKLGKWLQDHMPHFTGLKDVVTAIGEAFKKFGERIKKAATAAKPFGEKVKEIAGIIKDFILGIVDSIKHNETLAKILEVLKTAVSNVYQAVKDFITLKLPEYFEKIKEVLGEAWDNIKNSDLAIKFMDELRNATQKIKDGKLLEYLAEKLEQAKKAISDFVETSSFSFGGFGGEGSFVGWLQKASEENGLLSRAMDFLVAMEPELAKIKDALPGETNLQKLLSFLAILWVVVKTILGIKKIGAAISVTANLSDLFDSLSGLASAYAKSIRAESFKNLALGVLAIAAAIFIVASIKFDKMWPAAAALAAIIGVVYLAVSSITKLKAMLGNAAGTGNMLSDTLTPFIGAFKKMALLVGLGAVAFGFGMAFLGIAIGLAVMASIPWANLVFILKIARNVFIGLAGLFALIAVISRKASGLGSLVGGIGVGILAFVGAIWLFSKIEDQAQAIEIAKNIALGLLGFIVIMGIIAFILKGLDLVGPMKVLSDMISSFGKTAFLLGLTIATLSKVATSSAFVTIALFAALIAAIGFSIWLMTLNIQDKESIETASKALLSVVKTIKTLALVVALCARFSNVQNMLGILLALGIFVALIGVVVGYLARECDPKNVETAAKALAKVALMFAVLGVVVGLLGYFVSWQQLLPAAGAMLALIFAVWAVIKLTSKIEGADKATKNILVVSAAMVALSIAMAVLSRIKFTSLAKAVGAMYFILLGLVAALWFVSNHVKDAQGAAIAIVAIGAMLTVLAGVLYLLSKMTVGDIVKGLAALLIPLVAIVVALLVLSSVAPELGILSAAFTLMAVGALILAAAFLVTGVAINVVAAAIPPFAAGLMVLGSALVFVASLGPAVVGGAFRIGLALLFVGIGAIVAGAGFLVLGTGLQACALAIKTFAEALVLLSTSFEGFSRIINGVFNFLADKLSNIPVIGDYFKDLATDTSGGLTDAADTTQAEGDQAAETIQQSYAETGQAYEEGAESFNETVENTELAPEGGGLGGKILGIFDGGSANVLSGFADLGAASDEGSAGFLSKLSGNLDISSITEGGNPLASLTGTFTEGSGIIDSGFLDMSASADTGGMGFLSNLQNGFDLTSITEGGDPMAMLNGTFGTGTETITAGFDGMGAAATEGGAKVDAAVAEGLDVSDAAQNAGSDMPMEYAAGVNSNLGAATIAGQTIATTAAEGINSTSGEFTTAGEESVKAFANGEHNKKNRATKKGKEVGKAAATAMNQSDKAKKSGGYMVDGFCNGIADKLWKVRQKAAEMARTAINSANSTLDEQSPSKVFWQIGAYVTEGFANGISDKVIMADRASIAMAQSTIDRAAAMLTESNAFYDIGVGAITSLSAGLNADTVDYTPHITPVVNMGSAINSMNSLGAMRSNIDIGVARLDTQWSKLNDIVGQLDDMHVTTDNTDVVQAINTMRQDIYNLKDAIGSMQVVLNKRAIGVIDAELGKRARA